MLKTAPHAASAGSRRGTPALNRIRAMSLTEIAYRSQQEASKWLERVAKTGSANTPQALLADRAPALADPDVALKILREVAPRRFFKGLQHPETIATLGARLPDDCRDLVTAATDTMVTGRFDLLGYRQLSFGDPIDWRLDPVWGRQSPLVHWSQIDPLDPAVVGDSKIVWELNRHQWMIRLAQAWAITGDERYAERCITSIDAWLAANPPALGINWASSLEVSFRMMSWCWTLLLLRDLPSLSGEWVMKVLSAIWVHAEHVRRYLSYYFSPNTHLTVEALGLVYAGTLFPEFAYAARWRDRGRAILITESERQISADGVHFEQSTCYHRYTVDTYMQFLLLSERNGTPVPQPLVERTRRMVEFLLAVRQPDGSIPTIGDADGGTLLPLTPRARSDARGTFALAAALFKRADFAWAADGAAPEILWMLGAEGLSDFDALAPAPPGGRASRVFPAGGYAVLRSGWEPDAHQMIVDTGPLGCPVSSGHGHADLLGVQLSAFGEPCLVDSGTFCYTPESDWRDFFRSTGAHSSLVVDGRSQSETSGPFGWKRRPRVRLREWHSTPDLDFLDADSDAFLCLPDPVIHRRRVIFVKPRYWIIVDDLEGLSTHQVELTFQFAPLDVRLGPNRWARAQLRGGRALWLSPFASATLRPRLRTGEVLPIRGWISTDYGCRQPAPTLTYAATVALPWRVLTLVMPDEAGRASPPAVRLVYDDEGLPAGVVFERSGESMRVDERAVLVERE